MDHLYDNLTDNEKAVAVFRAMSARWSYIEQGEDGLGVIVTVSEDEIMASYYSWWRDGMLSAGKANLISEKNCIDDSQLGLEGRWIGRQPSSWQ